MSRRRLALVFVPIVILLFIWQLPAILRSIPSRYVAAYVPEQLQGLAVREHVDVLPTAAVEGRSGDFPIRDLPAEPSRSIQNDVELPVSDPYTITKEPNDGEDSNLESPISDGEKPPAITPFPSPTALPLIPSSSRLEPFKHQFQTWNNCGPATMAMALSFFGLDMRQEQAADMMKPDPEDRNVSPSEMARFVNEETEFSAIERVNGELDQLRRFIANGFPVIVELGLDPPGEYRWMGWYGHYLLIVAYDDSLQQFWVYDSWFGTSERPGENADDEGRQVPYDELDNYWRQFNRSYIVLFRPDDLEEIEGIIGAGVDDGTMWDQALEEALAELTDEPGNAFLWFNVGSAYNERGEFEKAAAAFDRARSIGLPWRMLWYQFGPYEAYLQTGRFQDVLVLADVTLQNRPYFEESYYYKGMALEALGNTEEAQENLQRAVNFNPRFEPAVIAIEKLQSAP